MSTTQNDDTCFGLGMPPTPPPDGVTWRVYRHGGARSHIWREVLATTDADKATGAYDKTHEHMRQGWVVLFSPTGAVARSGWAPRLRTRW